MSILSQHIDSDGIEIVTTSGSYTLTRQQAVTIFQGTSGSRSSRISQTIAIVLGQISAALGSSIDTSRLLFEFDDNNGAPLKLEWHHDQSARDAARSG